MTSEYGCWLYPDCQAESTDADVDVWYVGHMDGQSHFACPDHADTLWNPSPIEDHRKAPKETP